MASVTLPYNLTAGSPENVNNLMSNLNALKDGVNTIDTAQIANGAVTTAKFASTAAPSITSLTLSDNTSSAVTLSGASAGITFGTTTSANLYRSAADTLKTDDAFVVGGATFNCAGTATNTGGSWISVRAGTTNYGFMTQVTGDNNYRWQAQAGGTNLWGPGNAGPDTNLYRSAANVLKTDDQFVAVDGLTTRVKAGIPADGDFTATPASGTIAVDTTNSRIYVRVGTTWKYAALT